MFGLYFRNSTVVPNFSSDVPSFKTEIIVILILGLGDRGEENSKLEL